MTHEPRPRIGITANLLAPVWDRRFYKGKALQYVEEGMVQLIWNHGGLPIMVPVVGQGISQQKLAQELDGLLLSGGEDVSPELSGETARRPEWAGNPTRDHYEIDLINAFLELDKPILGICRGLQILNVALGGTLYQDLVEDGAVSREHRDPTLYDKLEHKLHVRKPSYLHDLYGVTEATVNTIHHQAIRELGRNLEVLAESDDGITEAIRHPEMLYVVGVQWHPEWTGDDETARGHLPPDVLVHDFIQKARSVM